MNHVADSLLLIRPSGFEHNPETASSNKFQNHNPQIEIRLTALREFESVLQSLGKENIDAIAFDDIPGAETPDAVFPNNWVSFHPNNRVILYPMMAPNRRKERRKDIVEKAASHKGIADIDYFDLTSFEKEGKFLEGTGSVVFDHSNKTAYAALSPRTHPDPFDALVEELGYEGKSFHTKDSGNFPIYHTNVLMSIGNKFAVVCEDVIYPDKSRKELIEKLESNGHELISINPVQMAAFAGNILQVNNRNWEPYVLLSESARKAFTTKQIRQLERHGTLLPVSISNIERTGGGSIRCMIAEIFLQKKTQRDEIVIRNPRGSELESAFDLRWKVLRAPWNQPKGSETDDQEERSIHFIALHGKKVVGTARLQALRNNTAQLRYMAVDPGYHGKGIGSKLISFMEKTALQNGWNNIFLQSRENAVAFYKANGYHLLEKTYLLFDAIQHFSMEKKL